MSLSRLQQYGHFLAPLDLHKNIKDCLEALVQIHEITFEIKSTPFEKFIKNERQSLVSIVKSKCYLETKVYTHNIDILVPKSQTINVEELAKTSENSHRTSSTSIRIDKSTITIVIGDLTNQVVSLINVESHQ